MASFQKTGQQQNSLPTLGADPRLAAALDLGFGSRGGFIDALENALTVLAGDIQPNPYVGLQQSLSRFELSCRDRDFEDGDRKISGDVDADWQLKNIVSLADIAIPTNHALRAWYHLGTVLGDELIRLRQNPNAHVAIQSIAAAFRDLPEEIKGQIPTLNRFIALDATYPGVTDDFIEQMYVEMEFKRKCFSRDANAIEHITRRIVRELQIDAATSDSPRQQHPSPESPAEVSSPRVRPRIRTVENPPEIPEVCVDGKFYPIADENLFTYVKAVVEANGRTIGPRHLKAAPYNLQDPRSGRLLNRLRKKYPLVADAIKVEGEGSRLEPAFVA